MDPMNPDQDPSSLMYWIALVITAVGGGAGLRKLLGAVKSAADTFQILPVLQQALIELQKDVKEFKSSGIQKQIDLQTENFNSLAKRIEVIDTTFLGWLGVSKDGVFVCDENGKVIWTNAECVRLAGVSREDLLSDLWKLAIHPEDIDRVSEAWNQYVSGKTRKFDLKYRFLHNDGTIVNVTSRAAIDRYGTGKSTRIVVILWRTEP